MNTKLTLTMDKNVIEEAKIYAKQYDQNLSALVENYLRLLTVQTMNIRPNQLSPRVQRLRGILKNDKNFDYKKVLTEEFSKSILPNDLSTHL